MTIRIEFTGTKNAKDALGVNAVAQKTPQHFLRPQINNKETCSGL
jgi:hypothetical protein